MQWSKPLNIKMRSHYYNGNNTCLTGKWLKAMNHSMLWPNMQKYQKPNIHLCNILIVDTIFSSSADFCQLYMSNLQKRVSIGKVKKKLLCSFIEVIPGRFRSLQKREQSMHPKQYIAEKRTIVLHRNASYTKRKHV